MLLSYHFKNFNSFKDDVYFDTFAAKNRIINRFPDNYVKKDDCNILKTSVIVGENAGGKTNFIKSIMFLKDLFKGATAVRSYKNTVFFFDLTEKSKEKVFKDTVQEFELEVLGENDIIYKYFLKIDMFGIVSESLSFKTNYKNDYQVAFNVERETNKKEDNEDSVEIRFHISANIKDEEILDNIARNKQLGLFVTAFAVLGVEHSIQFVNWINNTLHPVFFAVDYNNIVFNDMNKFEDIDILNDKKYLEILRLIDKSIETITVDRDKPFTDTLIIRKNAEDKIYKTKVSDDSTGVNMYFKWAVQIYKVIYQNKVIIADEIDNVLNPILSDRIIAFLHSKEHHGQFIFTTHNVLHLNLYTYMKEQIYFITKDRDTLSSEMYSLADFPSNSIRYDNAKIYEFYLKGILGGTAFE